MFRLASIAATGFLAFVFVTNAGISQDKKTDDKQPDTPKEKKGQLPKDWKKLNLSMDQTKKIYGIQADFKVKIKTLEDQIKDVKHQEYTEMYKVLTEKQQAELRKMVVPDDPKTGDDPKKKPDEPKKPADDKKP